MKKAQMTLSNYVTVLNEVVTTTEEAGEKMSPFYEKVKAALDAADLSGLSATDYTATKESFDEGVSLYQTLLAKTNAVRPPARVMGMNAKFKLAYEKFTEACQEMADSIDAENQTVDQVLFLSSEARQDEASTEITKWVQKISQTLM